MGSVQQAVLEFDEAVQAPWRPALRLVTGEGAEPAPRAVRPIARPRAYRDRVGRAQAPAPRAPRSAPAPTGPSSPRRPSAPPVRTRVPGAVRPRAGAVPSGAGGGAARRPAPGPVRLTRRARRLAVALALAGGVALGSWLGPLMSGGASGDLRLAGVSTVTVAPGDTLWSIAASVAADRDVRAVVDEIQRLNGLQGTDLVPGQVLELP